MFCTQDRKIRISWHLRRTENESCKLKYFDKFDVNSVEALLKKLETLQRMLRPSRVNRKLEMSQRKANRESVTENKQEHELLNTFRQDTSLVNIYHCYKCGSNFNHSRYRVNPIKAENIEAEALDMSRRRFQKFYICHRCENSTASCESNAFQSQITETHDFVIFKHYLSSNVDGETETHSNDSICSSKNIICFMPSTVDCIDNNHKNVKSRSDNPGIIYNPCAEIKDILAKIYENEVHKYKNAKLFGDRYSGVLGDKGQKVLKRTEKFISDASIVGSSNWKSHQFDNINARIQQLGSVCLFISVRFKGLYSGVIEHLTFIFYFNSLLFYFVFERYNQTVLI